MTNWSTLKTFEDWAGKLDELLDSGDQALRNDDVTRQVEVMKTLRAFRRESPNDTCRRLDEIAKQAVLDIAAASLQAGIRGLAERSAELDDHLRDVNAAASETTFFLGQRSSFTKAACSFSRLSARRRRHVLRLS